MAKTRNVATIAPQSASPASHAPPDLPQHRSTVIEERSDEAIS